MITHAKKRSNQLSHLSFVNKYGVGQLSIVNFEIGWWQLIKTCPLSKLLTSKITSIATKHAIVLLGLREKSYEGYKDRFQGRKLSGDQKRSSLEIRPAFWVHAQLHTAQRLIERRSNYLSANELIGPPISTLRPGLGCNVLLYPLSQTLLFVCQSDQSKKELFIETITMFI